MEVCNQEISGDDAAVYRWEAKARQAASVRAGTGMLASEPAGLGLKLPPGLQASVPDDIFDGWHVSDPGPGQQVGG